MDDETNTTQLYDGNLELKELQQLSGRTDRVWGLAWNPATCADGVAPMLASVAAISLLVFGSRVLPLVIGIARQFWKKHTLGQFDPVIGRLLGSNLPLPMQALKPLQLFGNKLEMILNVFPLWRIMKMKLEV